MSVPLPSTTPGHFVGLDLGQAADYTALAVVRRGPWGDDATRTAYDVVHLERLAIGTPYPAVARHVRALLERPELTETAQEGGWLMARIRAPGDRHRPNSYTPVTVVKRAPPLVVDFTGVGRPVVDMLRADKLEPVAVTITGGDQVTRDGLAWRVPKRDLVGALQVLLQSKRLRIARELPSAAVLVDELLRFRVKINPDTAHDSYGSWREGEHDDLVLALALAVWWAERPTHQAVVIPSRSDFTL
ncbi:MAG: hypothetical protein WKG32_08375 [Gemmatimonadaceae bacterium]